MVSESSQGIDQWLERENREKRVSRKGGSKKERGKKESGDGGSPRAYHDKNRQESPPAKTGERLIEVN